MEQEYIYGVARIRALEGSLFTDETINQLVQCKDYDEAMDFLRTKGWGNGNPDQSLEEMLEQERRRTWKVLDELIEDKEQSPLPTSTIILRRQLSRFVLNLKLKMCFMKIQKQTRNS